MLKALEPLWVVRKLRDKLGSSQFNIILDTVIVIVIDLIVIIIIIFIITCSKSSFIFRGEGMDWSNLDT